MSDLYVSTMSEVQMEEDSEGKSPQCKPSLVSVKKRINDIEYLSVQSIDYDGVSLQDNRNMWGIVGERIRSAHTFEYRSEEWELGTYVSVTYLSDFTGDRGLALFTFHQGDKQIVPALDKRLELSLIDKVLPVVKAFSELFSHELIRLVFDTNAVSNENLVEVSNDITKVIKKDRGFIVASDDISPEAVPDNEVKEDNTLIHRLNSGHLCPECDAWMYKEHFHQDGRAPQAGWNYYECPNCGTCSSLGKVSNYDSSELRIE